MKIIFIQVKRHIGNPARLTPMCLDKKVYPMTIIRNTPLFYDME